MVCSPIMSGSGKRFCSYTTHPVISLSLHVVGSALHSSLSLSRASDTYTRSGLALATCVIEPGYRWASLKKNCLPATTHDRLLLGLFSLRDSNPQWLNGYTRDWFSSCLYVAQTFIKWILYSLVSTMFKWISHTEMRNSFCKKLREWPLLLSDFNLINNSWIWLFLTTTMNLKCLISNCNENLQQLEQNTLTI